MARPRAWPIQASNSVAAVGDEAHGLSHPETTYGGRFRHSECGAVDASANPLCLDTLDAGFEVVVNIPVGAAGVVSSAPSATAWWR